MRAEDRLTVGGLLNHYYREAGVRYARIPALFQRPCARQPRRSASPYEQHANTAGMSSTTNPKASSLVPSSSSRVGYSNQYQKGITTHSGLHGQRDCCSLQLPEKV